MLHKNKEEFIKILERASRNKGFLLPLIEKDYYLTLILSSINNLSDNLIFIGGTCLNKIYYSYYRLSCTIFKLCLHFIIRMRNDE